jgi:uncharacterized protein (TIGR03083 family)
MSVDLEPARAAFLEALDAFVGVLDGLSDRDLLAASRCHGWTVLDVVAHVHLGLQEMLLGLVSPTDEPSDTDAASYWATPPPATDPTTDDVDQVRFVRRVASAYKRPSGLVAHLRLTTAGLTRAVESATLPVLEFQGHVMTTGDFLTTWVVELAVHQLDLGRELQVPDPPVSALTLARATVEALASGRLPTAWSDTEAVLFGSGRVALDSTRRAAAGAVGERLPVLG